MAHCPAWGVGGWGYCCRNDVSVSPTGDVCSDLRHGPAMASCPVCVGGGVCGMGGRAGLLLQE